MVSKKLIEIWKRRGLTDQQISEKLKDELVSIDDQPNPRAFGSLKNPPVRCFNPTPEVDEILRRVKKGRIGKFINKSILFYYQNLKN